ncbi:MAG: metallophosphoesterase [Polaromonas sp.]|nr:metallophosphoesterase [Polaromonas sp.]
MRLLHLSDIHFRSPDCENPATDRNQPYRTLLAQDAVELCREGGSVDAILVGGDIAFKGDRAEYKVARAWLLDLAHQCGCSPEGIYVVPGNHDIDRGVCAKSLTISIAQDAIAKASDEARESMMKRQLADGTLGQALFQPLAAYNEFAAGFDCSVYPELPFWSDEVELDGGVRLRLFGLTSTLISGVGDRDDAPGRLYLGRLQTVLNPEPDVVNLVLCHHPPSWLSDRDDTDDNVNDRAKLQFFGHEHRQRCTPTSAYMRFQAGAVNPDVHERDWKPGYNLLDISVLGEGLNRTLDVRAYVRHFQKAPEMFVALRRDRFQEVWTHSMPLPHLPPLGAPAAKVEPIAPYPTTKVAEAVHAAAAIAFPAEPKREVTMQGPSMRNLIYRFWDLSIAERRDIMLKFGLIDVADLRVPEPELYKKAFKQAAARGLLVELASEIERVENSH